MTLKDLSRSKDATIEHYGHTYLHPYVAAEYPDSMVQLSVLTAIHEYGKWLGQPHPMEAKLAAGLGKFFDRKLGVVRRTFLMWARTKTGSPSIPGISTIR